MLAVVTVVVLVSTLVSFCGLYRLRSICDYRIQPDSHIVVLGNSLGTTCFNDSILSGWRNLCRVGEYYVHSVPALEKIISVNSQIDTVMIVVGIPSLIGMDDEYFYNFNIGRLGAEDDRIALFDGWSMNYNIGCHSFVPYLLTSGFRIWRRKMAQDSFLYLQSHNLYHGSCSIDEYIKKYGENGSQEYSYKRLCSMNKVQMAGLERMIEICQKHQVTCVLFNTPLYHMDRFIDDKGYKEYLSTLDDSLLIADYASFVMPDTACYGDVHHLNGIGANYFCREIKTEGLKMEYLIDYLRKHSN